MAAFKSQVHSLVYFRSPAIPSQNFLSRAIWERCCGKHCNAHTAHHRVECFLSLLPGPGFGRALLTISVVGIFFQTPFLPFLVLDFYLPTSTFPRFSPREMAHSTPIAVLILLHDSIVPRCFSPYWLLDVARGYSLIVHEASCWSSYGSFAVHHFQRNSAFALQACLLVKIVSVIYYPLCTNRRLCFLFGSTGPDVLTRAHPVKDPESWAEFPCPIPAHVWCFQAFRSLRCWGRPFPYFIPNWLKRVSFQFSVKSTCSACPTSKPNSPAAAWLLSLHRLHTALRLPRFLFSSRLPADVDLDINM